MGRLHFIVCVLNSSIFIRMHRQHCVPDGNPYLKVNVRDFAKRTVVSNAQLSAHEPWFAAKRQNKWTPMDCTEHAQATRRAAEVIL